MRPHRGLPRRLLVPLVAAIAAVVLAVGCVDLDLAVTLEEDGSGVFTGAVAYDRTTVEQLVGRPVTADDVLAEGGVDPDQLPAAVDLERIETAERVGARLIVPFPASDDPGAAIASALAEVDGGGGITGPGGLFETFSLVRDGDRWLFAATTAESDPPDGLSALLLADASFRFRLALPGEVVEHNADRVEDGVLAWDLPVTAGSAEMRAVGAPRAGGVPARLILIGVVLLVVSAIVVATLVRPWSRQPAS